MKRKILFTVLTCMVSLFLSSSASAKSFAAEFKTFVDTVEANYKNYSEEQWKALNEQFDKYVSEFKAKKDSMSDEDRKSVHDDIGRYRGVVTNSGCDSAIKAVTNTCDKIGQSTTEAYNEVKGFFNGLFKKKDKDGEKAKEEGGGK